MSDAATPQPTPTWEERLQEEMQRVRLNMVGQALMNLASIRATFLVLNPSITDEATRKSLKEEALRLAALFDGPATTF